MEALITYSSANVWMVGVTNTVEVCSQPDLKLVLPDDRPGVTGDDFRLACLLPYVRLCELRAEDEMLLKHVHALEALVVHERDEITRTRIEELGKDMSAQVWDRRRGRVLRAKAG